MGPPTYLVIVHALAHLPLALDILGDVVGVVVEELRHGRQEHAPEDDAHGGGHTEGRIHRGVHPRLLDPGHQGSLVGEHLVKNMQVLIF